MRHMLGTICSSALLAAGLLLAPSVAAAQAQQNPENLQPKSADGVKETPVNYTQEQLLTATVHQAWLLSGKNEANFFDMVQKLAVISASNRGITLPESEAAGRRMGQYIKTSAKADTDQLLYAVVDKAVLLASHTPVHKAGSQSTSAK